MHRGNRTLAAGAVGRSYPFVDLAWLLGLALLVLGAGLGLRDPWPADEPRFALIARDMLAGGPWLIPHIGGVPYPDKPPLFFWTLAVALALTGSLRLAFLLPSLLAGLGTLVLVYDLARRLWGREPARAAALLLLACVQFAMQARSAQIDALLLFWSTLGLYGLVRHLLLGPAWGWYTVGGLAAGLGVITKGVGFLPLLVLLLYPLLRAGGFPRPTGAAAAGSRWAWGLAPAAALLGIAVWVVPMWLSVEASGDAAYSAYRNEILFHQTVERYAAAWHHLKPPWYFVLNVIPPLWLPATALLPWLVPRWRTAWRARELPVTLCLAWALLVVLFFSLSPGKRGVYVLPALPAVVLAAAPCLPELWRRAGPQRVGAALTALLAGMTIGAFVYLDTNAELATRLRHDAGLTSAAPLALAGALCVVALLVFRWRRGLAAFAVSFWAALIIQGLWVNPMINDSRSGRDFVAALERAVPEGAELGVVAWREQFLLYLSRPITHFGHSRWREERKEAEDAAVWLAATPGRVLLVNGRSLEQCFGSTERKWIGKSGRENWWLVQGPPDAECVAKGNKARERIYRPPETPAGHLLPRPERQTGRSGQLRGRSPAPGTRLHP